MSSEDTTIKIRVGIVGFGSLGRYLTKAILNNEQVKAKFELAFVWNRTSQKILEDSEIHLHENQILENLENFIEKQPNLIVEVAHPSISKKYGKLFVRHADLLVGSPTVFAEEEVEKEIRAALETSAHGVYIPAGAFWGAHDIQKMAMLGTLKGLRVTMKKHPSSLKVLSPLDEKLALISLDEAKETILYEGAVRQLCSLAPQNVNTMACASIAASNLGFDKVIGRLIADPSLTAHVIDIEVVGPGSVSGEEGTYDFNDSVSATTQEVFKVTTTRYNPAAVGAVSGNATNASFLGSLMLSSGRGNGIHFC